MGNHLRLAAQDGQVLARGVPVFLAAQGDVTRVARLMDRQAQAPQPAEQPQAVPLHPAVQRMREAHAATARLRQEIEARRLAAEARRRAIQIQNQNQKGEKK